MVFLFLYILWPHKIKIIVVPLVTLWCSILWSSEIFFNYFIKIVQHFKIYCFYTWSFQRYKFYTLSFWIFMKYILQQGRDKVNNVRLGYYFEVLDEKNKSHSKCFTNFVVQNLALNCRIFQNICYEFFCFRRSRALKWYYIQNLILFTLLSSLASSINYITRAK